MTDYMPATVESSTMSNDIALVAVIAGPFVLAIALILCVVIYKKIQYKLMVRQLQRSAKRSQYARVTMDRLMPGFTAAFDKRMAEVDANEASSKVVVR